MGLFDFLKSKKKKKGAVVEIDESELLELNDAELSGIEPPETRYTQEYRDFLASQEAEERDGTPPEEASGEQP